MRKLLVQWWKYQRRQCWDWGSHSGKHILVTKGNAIQTALGLLLGISTSSASFCLAFTCHSHYLDSIHFSFKSLPKCAILRRDFEILQAPRFPGFMLPSNRILSFLAHIGTCGCAPGWQSSMSAEKHLFPLELQVTSCKSHAWTRVLLGKVWLSHHFRSLPSIRSKIYSLCQCVQECWLDYTPCKMHVVFNIMLLRYCAFKKWLNHKCSFFLLMGSKAL